MNYLSLDIGTTGCKCQLFSNSGEILKYLFQEYDFKKIDNRQYVDIHTIETNLRKMILSVSKEYAISSICISSLGESFVLLDKDDNILFYPMLYTDDRGEVEAEKVKAIIGEETAFLTTGVIPHSMYSLSKLLWIKNNYPDIFAKADKVMLMCDYFGYLLTGERVIDYALASRTGAFDVGKLCFSKEILSAFDIPTSLFSTPKRAGVIVGKVKNEWCENAVLVLGSHDQVCTALGAGILEAGEAVDGMGTVECITTLFQEKPTSLQMGRQGYPCVPYAIDGLYCTYILNFSCGSTVNWLRKKIMHGYKGEEKDFFAYIEKDMVDEPTGILVLPYFGGASTPYQDLNAKGAVINLTTETTDTELYKSVMEGTAMEMRLNAETVDTYGVSLTRAVATGGGANSAKWLQIKSDVQSIPYKVLRSSEGGLCGCAMLQAVALGDVKDLQEAKEIFVRYTKEFTPNMEKHNAYESQYKKYKKLYKTLKEFY